MASSLLAALHAQDPRRKFVCPRTGLDIEVRLLSRRQAAAARSAAMRDWGSRDVKTSADSEEYASMILEHLLAAAVHVVGEDQPAGLDTIRTLDEQTLRRYAAEYSTLEDEFDPPVERWTDEQFDEFFEGLKKKDADSVARLRTFDAATLIGLVLYMGARLSSSETSSSPTSSSGNASDSPSSEETSE